MKQVRRRREWQKPARAKFSPPAGLLLSIDFDIALEDDDQSLEKPVPRRVSKEFYDNDYDL